MTGQLPAAVVIFMLLSLPGLVVAARMLRRVREIGGRVPSGVLGMPDVFVGFFLCGFFALLVVGQTMLTDRAGAAPVMNVGQIWGNIAFFLVLVGLIIGFLLLRRISPVALFGLRRWPLWRAALVGTLLVFAVFPLTLGLGVAMQLLLQQGAQEQDVVKLYREVAASGDRQHIALLGFVAVVFQPIVEETIFRGYFYSLFKDWSGAVASAIFTATLFAAIHGNLTALPALFALALALTLAYEWSGSLLVPISMHMVFNGVQLALVTWFQNSPPT
ncbi:MAG: type II CAAX endopeptidase family protein [Chthoniobacteraceae bacterium]